MSSFLQSQVVRDVSSYMYKMFEENPLHIVIELLLVGLIVFLFLQKAYKPRSRPDKLSAKEVQQLVDEWQPEPLAPALTEDEQWAAESDAVLLGPATAHTQVEGVTGDVINFSAFDFLGLNSNSRIIDRAVATVQKYGIGSCGPRGFYGTLDVHLDLEKQIAAFMGTEEAILYASGFNTVASAIPAFLKLGDLIICDEAVYVSIQQGCQLSRAEIKYFKHNDMAHLESLMRETVAADVKRKTSLNRRFVVVEGIYKNTGDMAPLQKIVELKEKYRFRVLLDESVSLGVLGATGRGLPEHVGIPRSKIDVTTAALSNSFCSVGGFCCGSHEVVDHQRLSGAAYCFSASVVPYLATSAAEALSILESTPALPRQARTNAAAAHKLLSAIPHVKVTSDPESPLVLVQVKDTVDPTHVVRRVADDLLHKFNILVAPSRPVPLERTPAAPHLRICVSVQHSAADLKALAQALERAVASALGAAPAAPAAAAAPAAITATAEKTPVIALAAPSTAAPATVEISAAEPQQAAATTRRRTKKATQ